MIINLLIARFFKRDLVAQSSQTDLYKDVDDDEQEQQEKSRVLTYLANHLHLTTMLPLAIITILQDVSLRLAGIVCVAEIVFFMTIGFLLYRRHYIKIYPKKYDIFNLQLYITITILAFAAPYWLHNYLSMYVNLSNAVFMWSTILLPWFDPFCMDNIRDRIPAAVARHPTAQAMALWISVTWALALTVMGVAAIIPAAADIPPGDMGLTIIMCSYVFGLGPLVVAIIVQNILSHVYKKRLVAVKEQAAAAAAAAQPPQPQQMPLPADKIEPPVSPSDTVQGLDAV